MSKVASLRIDPAPENCFSCPVNYRYHGNYYCTQLRNEYDSHLDVNTCDTNRHIKCPLIIEEV